MAGVEKDVACGPGEREADLELELALAEPPREDDMRATLLRYASGDG